MLLAILVHSNSGLQLQVLFVEYTVLIFPIHWRRYACVVRLCGVDLMRGRTTQNTHVALGQALVELGTI